MDCLESSIHRTRCHPTQANVRRRCSSGPCCVNSQTCPMHAGLTLLSCQRGCCPRILFLSPGTMLLPPLPGSFPAQMALAWVWGDNVRLVRDGFELFVFLIRKLYRCAARICFHKMQAWMTSRQIIWIWFCFVNIPAGSVLATNRDSID